MTREEQAIEHIKKYRELDEKLYNTAPKGTVSSIAAKKCLEFWDMAISALENHDTFMKYAYSQGKQDALSQEPCDDAISRKAVLDIFGYVMDYWKEHAIDVEPHEIKDALIEQYEFTAKQLNELPSVTQKPIECDDAISREELLKAISTWDKFGVDDTNSLFRLDNLSLPHYVPYIHYDDVIKCIKGMPSVTQKSGEWTPVSEGLPEENETVMASAIYGVYPEAKYTKEYGWEWAYEAGADYWKKLEDVTAWMPLPKPYEPQESEKVNCKSTKCENCTNHNYCDYEPQESGNNEYARH